MQNGVYDAAWSMMKKITHSGDISITKGYFVAKFFKCSLFFKAFLLVVFKPGAPQAGARLVS